MPRPRPQRQRRLTDFDPSQGVAIFTDGSAWAGDGSGGWAWVAIDAFEGEIYDSGYEPQTTNNRMEMLAWVKAFTTVYELYGACEVLIYSDSEYVGKGAMDRTRKRVKNIDLWHLIDAALDQHEYAEFIHVRGHDGHPYNEMADQLAGAARRLGRESDDNNE